MMMDLSSVDIQHEDESGRWGSALATLDGWGITTNEGEPAFNLMFNVEDGLYEFHFTIPQLEEMLAEACRAGTRLRIDALRAEADALEATL